MSLLLKNAAVVPMDGENTFLPRAEVLVEGGKIARISTESIPGEHERVVDCGGKTLLPGLYNTHTHVPMALLRSVGEGLSLSDWLNQKIFPAEDRLTKEIVFTGALLGIAEMIRFGTVSFTDMYFFSDEIARAALEVGMKANIGRCLVAFDESDDLSDDSRIREAKELYNNYHNAGGGRIKIDVAVHSVYASTRPLIRRARDLAQTYGLRTQIHLSETQKENNDCMARYQKSPTRVFCDEGFFETPGIAAHAVYLSKEDMEILAEKNITAVHNPVSNLKLASGIANLQEMQRMRVPVSLGTDGPASNNTTDLFEEMKLSGLLAKIKNMDPVGISPYEILKLATVSGARSQGRERAGQIKEGYDADLILVDTNAPHIAPNNDFLSDLVYAAKGSDVVLTMVGGRILYEDGEFKTLDIEKIKAEARSCARKLLA